MLRSQQAGRPRQIFRVMAMALVVAALAVYAWLEHATVSRSIGVVGRAQWGWLLAACGFELLSLMAFARTERIVLRAAGVRASIPAMAATALVGNAISVSVPLIGPGAASVFSYGRFRQVSNDPAPATWTLIMCGLISNFVWILLIAIGAIVSDNAAAAFSGIFAGVLILLAATLGVLALRRPRSRNSIIRVGALLVRLSQRLSSRPEGDPEDLTRGTLDALSGFRMRAPEWTQALLLAFINWLASVACFVASILAVGASVPWTKVVLVYCAGAAASSFNLTPGGLGVTEAVLAAGLVASGLRPPEALGSVLIFRFISFWLVTAVGWTIYSALRRNMARRRLDTEASLE
jgi:putative heme transporter